MTNHVASSRRVVRWNCLIGTFREAAQLVSYDLSGGGALIGGFVREVVRCFFRRNLIRGCNWGGFFVVSRVGSFMSVLSRSFEELANIDKMEWELSRSCSTFTYDASTYDEFISSRVECLKS